MSLAKTEPAWPVLAWIQSIDGLRGLAALAVVIPHSGQPWSLAHSGTLFSDLIGRLGSFGVNLFFVLSGFCIHLPLARRGSLLAGGWREFARRRAWRLLPTHYAALVLSAIGAIWFPSELINAVSAGAFAAHLVMVHVWLPAYIYSISAVFWTIAIEVHFYAAYPIYLQLRKMLGPWVTVFALYAIGLIFYGIASVGLPEHWRQVGQNFFLVSWWQWAAGAALADLYIQGKPHPWTPVFTWRPAVFIWALLSLAVVRPDVTIFHLHVIYWIQPVFCVGLLGAVVLGQHRLPTVLGTFGVFSYSIYLVHPVALAFFYRIPALMKLPEVLAIPVVCVGSVFTSWLFFLTVERYFLSNRQRTHLSKAAPLRE